MKNVICFILLFLVQINCFSSDYTDLFNKTTDAFMRRDLPSLKKCNDEISIKELISMDGIKYLELKVYILSILDDYDELNYLFESYSEIFNKDIRFSLAEAIIKNWNSDDSLDDYNRTIDLILETKEKNIEEVFYLCYIINVSEVSKKSEIIDIVNNYSFSTNEKRIIDLYNTKSSKYLLKNPPIRFISRVHLK